MNSVPKFLASLIHAHNWSTSCDSCGIFSNNYSNNHRGLNLAPSVLSKHFNYNTKASSPVSVDQGFPRSFYAIWVNNLSQSFEMKLPIKYAPGMDRIFIWTSSGSHGLFGLISGTTENYHEYLLNTSLSLQNHWSRKHAGQFPARLQEAVRERNWRLRKANLSSMRRRSCLTCSHFQHKFATWNDLDSTCFY